MEPMGAAVQAKRRHQRGQIGPDACPGRISAIWKRFAWQPRSVIDRCQTGPIIFEVTRRVGRLKDAIGSLMGRSSHASSVVLSSTSEDEGVSYLGKGICVCLTRGTRRNIGWIPRMLPILPGRRHFKGGIVGTERCTTARLDFTLRRRTTAKMQLIPVAADQLASTPTWGVWLSQHVIGG